MKKILLVMVVAMMCGCGLVEEMYKPIVGTLTFVAKTGVEKELEEFEAEKERLKEEENGDTINEWNSTPQRIRYLQ